ncbi:MAG: SoxR reducing system RseC family protein [Clostridia bacterium]|nr:SoxR reducing system RseC family protein [Clostridia bacterium]
MTKEAIVVNTEKGLKAEVIRSEACAHCRGCQIGQTERLLCDLPEGDYKEGDTVVITLSDHALTKATLLAYGVPLAALVAGLLLGSAIFKNEIAQATTAGVFTLAGLVWLALTEKKRRQSGSFECRAQKAEKDV